jgi:hypothetical protein
MMPDSGFSLTVKNLALPQSDLRQKNYVHSTASGLLKIAGTAFSGPNNRCKVPRDPGDPFVEPCFGRNSRDYYLQRENSRIMAFF